MKNLILILVLLISTIANAQWVKVSNMYFRAAAVTGSNIYAAKDLGEVYRAVIGDTSWVKVSSNINTGGSVSLAVNGNRIFAGSPNGFYYTTDGDTNWTQTFTGGVSNILSTPTGLYIISGGYVWRSSNNGVSFVQTASPQNPTALGSNVNGSIIYTGKDTLGLYMSNNNGSSWLPLAQLDSMMIRSIKTNGNNIYVTTLGSTSKPGSIWISTNNGTNWTRKQIAGITLGYGNIVIVNNDIFVGAVTTILMSRDNGNTWRRKDEGLTTFGPEILTYGNGYLFSPSFGSTYKRLYSEIISVRNISTEVPDKFSLSQNYPNPFNPSTTIRFQISKAQYVDLRVFDITGKEIAVLVSESQTPGTYEVNWDASKYSSGVYFYRIEAEKFIDTKRMLLIK